MSRAHKQYLRVTAAILAAGVLVFVLHANLGMTSVDQGSPEVRMPVDPTVLPPIVTGEEAPLENESMAPEAGQDTIETVTDEPATTEQTAPAPQPDPEPAAEPAPEPAAPKQAETPAPAPKGKGKVNAIELAATDDNFSISVEANRPIGDTSYMNLYNPRRLVIDLREPWNWTGKNVIRSRSAYVEYVVIGEHKDRLRLVVHFRRPPAGKLVPRMERTGNMLIVTVP